MHPVAVLFCVGGMVCGWADSALVCICRWGLRKDHGTIPLSCISGKRERDHPKRRTHHVPAHDHEGHARRLSPAPAGGGAPPGHHCQIPPGSAGLCARHLEPGQPVEKETVLAWKAALARRYAAGTVNGKLAALNTFFAFLGWGGVPGESPPPPAGTLPGPGAGAAQGGTICACWPRRKGRATGGSTTSWRPWPPRDPVSELKFVTVQALHAGRAWGGREGEGPSGPPHPQAVPGAGQVLPAAGDCCGAGVRHPDGAAHDRSNIWKELHTLCQTGGGGGGHAGLPPQLPAPLRPGFLRSGKGYCKAGGPLGPRQRGDDENLYHGERRRAPAPGGTAGIGGLVLPQNFGFVVPQAGKPTCVHRKFKKNCHDYIQCSTHRFLESREKMEKCTKVRRRNTKVFSPASVVHFENGKIWNFWRGVPAREPVGTTKPKFCGSPGEGPKNEGGEQCEKV